MKHTLTLFALVFGMKASAQTELLNAAKNDFSGFVKMTETLYHSQDGKAKLYAGDKSIIVRDTGKLVDQTYSYCAHNYEYIGEHTIDGVDFQVFIGDAHTVYIHIAVERIMLVVKK